MGISAARELTGGDRVLGVAIAVVAALLFGAAAFRAARKRGLSEMDW
jgi:hypothetical protein